TYLNPKP
ncbi:hypothetical protein COHA_006456, partial [Chlorella ohadii]